MATEPEERWISLEEYHEMERNSDIRYEYCDGHVYQISGQTAAHSRITINILTKLYTHLQDKPCEVVNSDMPVWPSGGENPTYRPDATVTCNPDDCQDDATAIRFPRLIVEVLSPSTVARDRDEKFEAYLECSTVEEYVMVSSHHQRVEVYRRESANTWENIQYNTAEDSVQLASVGLTIPIAEIYAKTEILPLGLPDAVFYPY